MQKTKPRTTPKRTTSKPKTKLASAKKPVNSKAKRAPSAAKKKLINPHLLRLHHLHFGLTSLLALSTFIALMLSLGASTTQTSASTACTVSATLVNSCRPWLGAAVNGYPTGSNFAAQIADHESRIGRQLDIVHDYRTPGQVMSSDEQSLAKRANTILLLNWKPTTNWASANSNNATLNTQVDNMANSIKSLGSTKIMLTVFHEAENDVSANGDPNCHIAYKGSDGTTADYVNMWHYVHDRFVNVDHVTNVVWVMNYMGYSGWDCLVNDMWPGNSYVDWVMWDPYDNSGSFSNMAGRFYNLLTANSNSAHDYVSKPWGLAEWGSQSSSQSAAYSLYDSAKTAVDNNTFPRLKAYVIWDSNSNGYAYQTQYTLSGAKDQTEQNHYNAFAQDAHFTNAFYQGGSGGGGTGGGGSGGGSGGGGGGTTPPPAPAPTPDKTAPTVTLTSPSNNSTIAGTITVTGTASDNVGVTAVTMRVDDTYVSTDNTAPYSFSLDTSKLKAGNHTIALRAWDAANNMGQSNTITVKVMAATASPGGGGGVIITPITTKGGQPETVIVFGGSPTTNTIAVKGTVKIVPSTPGGKVSVQVDGKPVANATVNTTQLTDGTHTVTVTQDGKTTTQKISVDNPWPTAAMNNLKAHPVAYTAGGTASLAMLVLLGWFARKYTMEILETIRTRDFVRFGPGGIVSHK